MSLSDVLQKQLSKINTKSQPGTSNLVKNVKYIVNSLT